jgi:hypothetical protein
MPKTTVQLSRAVEHNGRMVDAVTFTGEPGTTPFPVNRTGGACGVDALEVVSVMIRRTGLSKPALERLAPIDLLTVALTLFLPSPAAEERRKAKK